MKNVILYKNNFTGCLLKILLKLNAFNKYALQDNIMNLLVTAVFCDFRLWLILNSLATLAANIS